MLQTRVIPTLLLRNESLIKTKQFKNPVYIGDPCNTVRIFNELEVDELIFLDIYATREGRRPNIRVLSDISNECFMPLAYGGGIHVFEDVKDILKIGFEKITINSHAFVDSSFITKTADHFGSQAIIASIDVKKDIFGRPKVFARSGTKNTHKDPLEWAQELESLGAGEILITSIDREGTWEGFDDMLIRSIAKNVNIPVIANGGAGTVDDIYNIVNNKGATAVGLGSMVVFQKKGMGVLVNFPDINKNNFDAQ